MASAELSVHHAAGTLRSYKTLANLNELDLVSRKQWVPPSCLRSCCATLWAAGWKFRVALSMHYTHVWEMRGHYACLLAECQSIPSLSCPCADQYPTLGWVMRGGCTSSASPAAHAQHTDMASSKPTQLESCCACCPHMSLQLYAVVVLSRQALCNWQARRCMHPAATIACSFNSHTLLSDAGTLPPSSNWLPPSIVSMDLSGNKLTGKDCTGMLQSLRHMLLARPESSHPSIVQAPP